MISPEQNNLVVQWLATNSKRPLNAVKIWSTLFEYVYRETGEIMLTRQQIADKIQVLPRHVSSIMSELESIKAITKEKKGRGITYYINLNVGTYLNQEDRDKAKEKASIFKVIDGGKV